MSTIRECRCITVKTLRPRRALLRVDGIGHESQLVPSHFFRTPCGILADTLRRIMRFELYIACFFAVITPTSRFPNDTHCEKRFTSGARDPQHGTPLYRVFLSQHVRDFVRFYFFIQLYRTLRDCLPPHVVFL